MTFTLLLEYTTHRQNTVGRNWVYANKAFTLINFSSLVAHDYSFFRARQQCTTNRQTIKPSRVPLPEPVLEPQFIFPVHGS